MADVLDERGILAVDMISMEKVCAILCREAEMPPLFAPGFKFGAAEDYLKKARASYREVNLTGEWWESSYGNFLGFYKDSGKPVALINRAIGHYELIAPSTKPKRVDMGVKSSLSAKAYVIYPPSVAPLNTFRKIISFCSKGMSKEYGMTFLTGFLATVISFFFPFANKVLFDNILPDFNLSLFVQVLIGLTVATLGSAIFVILRSLFSARINGILECNLQSVIWEKIFRLPLSFFRSVPIGDLLQRTMIVEEVRKIFNNAAVQIITNGLFSVFYILVMLFFSPGLTFLILGIALATAILTAGIAMLRIRHFRRLLEVNAKIHGFLLQVVNGISKLRVAEAVNRVFLLWSDEFATAQKLQYRAQNLQNYLTTWIATIRILIPLALFAGIAYQMRSTGLVTLSLGSFFGFYTAMNLFLDSLFELCNQISMLVHSIPFWERASLIVTAPPESTENLSDPGKLSGQIKVENLSFRYDSSTPFILENINMEFPKGSWISLTGPSGCGKSTLCKLLVGLEKPQEGLITFDGKDISGMSLSGLREQMGVLLQTSSAIFSGSIYDNITCGNAYSLGEIDEVLEKTGFSRDLAELPMRLHTHLPKEGSILSGGQKQRLLLTRALLRKPKILILDEALSALDWASLEPILQQLAQLEITRIVISHSPKLQTYADRVYTFSKGKIELTRFKHQPYQLPFPG